jgi:cbb3-type cytochrome c oxidase subunit II
VEVAPLYYLKSTIETVQGMRPYTPLELAGRNIYVREGCYNCHSQMIRPFRAETERYGHYSVAGESVYDHPFPWGSKRTGPDLARLAGRYSDVWHYKHLLDPRELTPGSNMPSYAHLSAARVDFDKTPDKLRAMRSVGVPYSPEQIANSTQSARLAAQAIAAGLSHDANVRVASDSELVALIGYLQRLGRAEATLPTPPASKSGPIARAGGR